jgi:hypothetical protein
LADQWLQLSGNTFRWTLQKEERAVFVRAAKFADNEGQVGELAPGEVALYEHRAYHGKTWILTNSENDVAGNYRDLRSFHGLNDASLIHSSRAKNWGDFVQTRQQSSG